MATSAREFVESRRRQFYPKADLGLEDSDLLGLGQLSRQISSEQARVALKSMGIEVGSLIPMEPTGTFHELFMYTVRDVKRSVLKVNRLSAMFVDFPLISELAVSKVLTDHQIHHGNILAVDCSRSVVPFDFQVMDYVAGDSFRSFDSDEDAVTRHLPALAAYLRDCHRIEGQGFGLVSHQARDRSVLTGLHTGWLDYLLVRLDRHIWLVSQAGLVSPNEVADIHDVFRELASIQFFESSRLLHGDCGPHNSILTPDGNIALIDWEDALFGDPLFEVAMWATFNPQRRWRTFFDGYFAKGWEPDFYFWAYFLRISLAKTVVRLRFGYKDQPGRELASMRIQRALAAISSIRKSH